MSTEPLPPTTPQTPKVVTGEAVFSGSSSFLHYDATRVDYAISDAELNQLSECMNNIWKDFFLGCMGIGIPCLINAIPDATKTPFTPTLGLFLNLLLGVLGLVLGAAFCIAWRKTKGSAARIVAGIKAKPKIKLPG